MKITINPTKVIIKNDAQEEKSFQIKTKDGLNYIQYNQNLAYYLIDNLSSFDSKDNKRYLVTNNIKIVSTNVNINLDECLFAGDIYFKEVIFDGSASFNNAIFDGKALFEDCQFNIDICFDKCEFNQNVNFINAKFYKELSFMSTIFKKKTIFKSCDFIKNATFNKSQFLNIISLEESTCIGKISLEECKFKMDTWLDNIIFNDGASFHKSSFDGDLGFREAKISGKINFSKVNVKDKFIFSEVVNNGFVLDLKHSKMPYIDYWDTNIGVENSENRETFTLLKSRAIEKDDQISALNFHNKEMEKYKNFLQCKKGMNQYFILWFEKHFSNFGTSVLKPILWLLFINIIMFLAVLHNDSLYNNDWSNIKNFMHFILPFSDIEKIFDCKSLSIYSVAINLFNSIITSILLYEIIKSFRQFSRKI